MIVVDASVTNKLFLYSEEDHDIANLLFRAHSDQSEQIIVPNLIFYEVANTLATKTSIPQIQMTKSLSKLYKLNLNIVDLSEEEVKLSAKFAKKYKVSVYDAAYAVLAKQKKCKLITADTKFVSQVKLPFIRNLKDYSKSI